MHLSDLSLFGDVEVSIYCTSSGVEHNELVRDKIPHLYRDIKLFIERYSIYEILLIILFICERPLIVVTIFVAV